jgi:hypothetical protein
MKKSILSVLCLRISAIVSFSQSVGINKDGSTPDPTAILDVKSTSQGMLVPRMTIAQRNAIATPAEGLMVFCTDCGVNGALALYSNSQWRSYQDCITSPPVAGTAVATVNSIQWGWTCPLGGTAMGYKFNATNDYATATDKGNVLTYTETGLNCNTPYTRYLWAYTGCGVSTPITLIKTTIRNPVAPDTSKVPNTDTQITWNWKAVSGAAGYKWNTATWSPVPAGNVWGLCPPGWHIPSEPEYYTLKSIITNLVVTSMSMSQEGGCMRENSSYGRWAVPTNPANDGNNYTGFTAVGPGIRNVTSPAYWGYFNTTTSL